MPSEDDSSPSSPAVPWEVAAPLLGIRLIGAALETRGSEPTSSGHQALEHRLEFMSVDDVGIGSHVGRFLVAVIPVVAHSVAQDLALRGEGEVDPRQVFGAAGVARALALGTFDAEFEAQMVSLIDAIARSHIHDGEEADAVDTQTGMADFVADHLSEVLRWTLDIHAGMLFAGTQPGPGALVHARRRLGELATLFGFDPDDVLADDYTARLVHVRHDMAHLVVTGEYGAEQPSRQ